ncbi:MAG: response regulator [Anaerolineae bacterium]|jgi:CheY-like chemotaxis protein
MAKSRILIVEDDPEIIQLYSLFLTRSGHEPIPALGGEEALRILEEIEVDLIILDLMMPVMDGWTLLETIRQNERLRQVPVIIATVKHPLENEGRIENYVDLFEGYLMKPFVGESLMKLIDNTLRDPPSRSLPAE